MGTLTLKSGGQQPKTFEINKTDAELSKFVTTILEGDAQATSIEIRQVPPETLEHVVAYLQHHKGKEPDPLPCPVRSIHMAQIVSDKWDATWIDAFDKKTIFEIILAANYMDIKSLLHLGCAKIATLIKLRKRLTESLKRRKSIDGNTRRMRRQRRRRKRINEQWRERKRRSIGGNLMVIVFCDGIKECSMCPWFTTILWYPPFPRGGIAWREGKLVGVMMM